MMKRNNQAIEDLLRQFSVKRMTDQEIFIKTQRTLAFELLDTEMTNEIFQRITIAMR